MVLKKKDTVDVNEVKFSKNWFIILLNITYLNF